MGVVHPWAVTLFNSSLGYRVCNWNCFGGERVMNEKRHHVRIRALCLGICLVAFSLISLFLVRNCGGFDPSLVSVELMPNGGSERDFTLVIHNNGKKPIWYGEISGDVLNVEWQLVSGGNWEGRTVTTEQFERWGPVHTMLAAGETDELRLHLPDYPFLRQYAWRLILLYYTDTKKKPSPGYWDDAYRAYSNVIGPINRTTKD